MLVMQQKSMSGNKVSKNTSPTVALPDLSCPVMKELESDDALWQTNQKKRELRAQEQDAQKGPSSTLTTIPPLHTSTSPQSTTSSPPLVDPTPRRPGFY